MKLDAAKILIYLTFVISVIFASFFFIGVSNDLKKTVQQADDEMSVLTMMDHLYKLNTSLTYIERNEKPFILAKYPSKSEEIEKGYFLARKEMDSLKGSCDLRYFNCEDILKLDEILTEKIAFSKQIVSISKSGFTDSARKLLEGRKDSIIVNGLIKQYNIVYDQGKNFVIKFQEDHSKETLKNYNIAKFIAVFFILFLFFVCWRLIFQIKLKDKVLAQKRIFAKIINNSSESIVTTNTNFELTYINSATASLFKINADSFLGKNPEEVFKWEESLVAKNKRYQALQQYGSWLGEISGYDIEGNRIDFQTTITSIKDEKNNCIGYFVISTDISKIKNAQKEIAVLASSLQNTNELLELKVQEQTGLIKEIFERIDDIFIGMDEKLQNIYINKNASRLLKLGATKEPEIDILTQLSNLTNLNILSIVETSFKSQQPVSNEFICKDKSGCFYKLDVFPSLNGVSILIKDITSQKLAEEEIRKSARFFKLISAVNDTIIHAKTEMEIFSKICELAIDPENIIFSWVGMPDMVTNKMNPILYFGKDNGYIEKVRNISIDNVPSGNGPSGRAYREGKLYYTNDIANDPNMEIWREAALERNFRSSISLPIMLDHKPYAIFAFYASKPFYFTKEEIQLLEQVAENVSFAIHNIQLEKQKNETEQQLNKLSHAINQSSVSVMISDLNGNIEYVNPAFEKLTGYQSEEVLGKNPSFLQSGVMSKEDYSKLWETILVKGEWRGEFCNKKKNGETYWEQAIISCFSNADGIVKNYVAVKVDISDRKKLEADQMQMALDLYQRNKNLEEFSYILSYNIRGPLSNILGLTDALKLDLGNEDRKIIENSIGIAARAMDVVIKDVNTILQVRQSQGEQLETIEFQKIVSEIQEDLSYLITKKSAIITTDFAAAFTCFSIRNYVRSIFFNLIMNSLKFSKLEQPVTIHIRSEIVNNSIVLYFKDNGLGIDLAKNSEKIFGLYKRFNLDIEGRGIGLFLIKSQLEYLKGKISVSSVLGEWTEFKVELPL